MRLTRPAFVVIVGGWLFLVTSAYFIANKPFGLANALAVGDTFANVFVVSLILIIAGSIGRRLLRRFEFASVVESSVFNIALGLGVLSLATLAIGMFLVDTLFFWVILLVTFFLLRKDAKEIFAAIRTVRITLADRFEKFCLAFIVIVLLLGFWSALSPPLGWDAQIYHLTIGKSALEAGRITAPHDRFTFSYPSFGEMLFLAAIALKGDVAAQFLVGGFGRTTPVWAGVFTFGALASLGLPQ